MVTAVWRPLPPQVTEIFPPQWSQHSKNLYVSLDEGSEEYKRVVNIVTTSNKNKEAG